MPERTFLADDSTLADALSFVEEQLEAHDASMKTIMQITVCVEEMYVNVAHYAYGDNKGDVTMSVDFEGNVVTISLIDSGMPFDPLKKEDPDITLSAEERDIGGLGIFMVKKSMDDVSYEYKDGKNIFVMKKAI